MHRSTHPLTPAVSRRPPCHSRKRPVPQGRSPGVAAGRTRPVLVQPRAYSIGPHFHTSARSAGLPFVGGSPDRRKVPRHSRRDQPHDDYAQRRASRTAPCNSFSRVRRYRGLPSSASGYSHAITRVRELLACGRRAATRSVTGAVTGAAAGAAARAAVPELLPELLPVLLPVTLPVLLPVTLPRAATCDAARAATRRGATRRTAAWRGRRLELGFGLKVGDRARRRDRGHMNARGTLQRRRVLRLRRARGRRGPLLGRGAELQRHPRRPRAPQPARRSSIDVPRDVHDRRHHQLGYWEPSTG